MEEMEVEAVGVIPAHFVKEKCREPMHKSLATVYNAIFTLLFVASKMDNMPAPKKSSILFMAELRRIVLHNLFKNNKKLKDMV